MRGVRWMAAGSVLAGLLTAGAAGAAASLSCEGVDGFGALDFWVGEWDVLVAGRQVGTNRITKILDGCAIVEEWTDARGAQGRSLFYYISATAQWKQVWVTANATRPGGVKEKTLVERLKDGSLRFLGEIPLPDGGRYTDRTTLTPLDGGRVRQLIETSVDGGRTWRTGFDAVYERRRSAIGGRPGAPGAPLRGTQVAPFITPTETNPAGGT